MNTANEDSKEVGSGRLLFEAATCSVRLHRELSWQPDDATGECAECAAPFNFVRRRHHCRGCGRLLCGECSRYKVHACTSSQACLPSEEAGPGCPLSLSLSHTAHNASADPRPII